MTKKSKLAYIPKLKLNDLVMDKIDGGLGVIFRIDNKCSKLHDIECHNPGYLEYYINWFDVLSITRHYCFEVDLGDKDCFVVSATKAAKVLYGKARKNKKKGRIPTSEEKS